MWLLCPVLQISPSSLAITQAQDTPESCSDANTVLYSGSIPGYAQLQLYEASTKWKWAASPLVDWFVVLCIVST